MDTSDINFKDSGGRLVGTALLYDSISSAASILHEPHLHVISTDCKGCGITFAHVHVYIASIIKMERKALDQG